MAQLTEISIDCGTGAGAYKVVLSGKDLSAFEKLDQNQAFIGKKGEEIVSTILATAKPGNIWRVTRLKDKKRNDGPNGEYAVEYFSKDGLSRHWRYQNDVRNDGPDGAAAYVCKQNGRTLRIEHYINNKSNDGVNGEPGLQVFGPNNALDFAFSYKEGVKIKRLSQDEVAAYQKKSGGSAVKPALVPKAPNP